MVSVAGCETDTPRRPNCTEYLTFPCSILALPLNAAVGVRGRPEFGFESKALASGGKITEEERGKLPSRDTWKHKAATAPEIHSSFYYHRYQYSDLCSMTRVRRGWDEKERARTHQILFVQQSSSSRFQHRMKTTRRFCVLLSSSSCSS